MRFTSESYSSAPGEARDCSVRALASASGMSYEEARRAFERHGRRAGEGTPHGVTQAVIAELFPGAKRLNMHPRILMRAIGRPVMTVPQFARAFGRGRWVVHVDRHALAVTDGVVHDWRPRPATRVTHAWRIA